MKIIKFLFSKILLLFLGIVIFDTCQSLLFNTKPFIKLVSHDNTIKSFLVTNYDCKDYSITTLNNKKYSCPLKEKYVVVDTSSSISGFGCAQALEEIYNDNEKIYYLPCMKSKYIKVIYSNGNEENIVNALKNKNIDISDLDKYKIEYITKKIKKNYLIIKKDDNNLNKKYKLKNSKLFYYEISNALIKINNTNYELSEALNKKYITISDITKYMDLLEIYKDGGSRLYTSASYNILVCNTISGNKNIYIGPNSMKYETDFCS